MLTGRVASLAHVRIKELADKEKDVDKKMGLRKVFRSLQGVGLGERYVIPQDACRECFFYEGPTGTHGAIILTICLVVVSTG